MDCRNTYYELGDHAHEIIRAKARSLIGKAGFTQADRDDIEQELAMDLLARLGKYDPKRSKRTTFMMRVVEHRVVTMLEERHAACRDWRLCRESLDEPEPEEPEEAPLRIDNRADRSAMSREDLARAIDLGRAIEGLPPDLRELWDRLLESNLHRIARATGVSRSTLLYRVERLRAALREAGL